MMAPDRPSAAAGRLATTAQATAQATAAAGRRIADYVVLATAPEVPLIAADYWQRSAASYARVDALARSCAAADGVVARAYLALRAAPGDPAAHRDLSTALTRLLGEQPWRQGEAAALNALPDARIWIDYRLGPRYTAADCGAGLGWLAGLPASRPAAGPPAGRAAGRPAGRAAAASVLIPFRDARRGARLRNLLACLRALRDQEPGAPLLVTVVETDTAPRCRDLIEPLADRYLFARKGGLFNKSWAVNVGLRAAGHPSAPGTPPLTCVLDADILADRGFAARNVNRFTDPAHDAHLPFRWSFALDGPSTSLAISQRVRPPGPGAGSGADPARLRGLLLREPPGGCVWARTALLHRIGGFDERFEGWGGEDDDMIARLGRVARVTRFDDDLLHLDHPRPPAAGPDGLPLNAHLAGRHEGADAWTGAGGFGDPGRFAPAAARPILAPAGRR